MVSAKEVVVARGRRIVLSGVDLQLDAGLHAVIGPNGSGKSTLLGALCGLLRVRSGAVRIGGRDPRRHPGVFGAVGIVPTMVVGQPHETAADVVRHAALLGGVAEPDRAVCSSLLAVGVEPDDRTPVAEVSLGTSRRIAVASSLVTGPSVLFADEPLASIDPSGRQSLRDLFVELASQGRCVITTAHDLREAAVADQVVLLEGGRVVALGAPADVGRQLDSGSVVVLEATRCLDLSAALVASGLVTAVDVTESGRIRVVTTDLDEMAGSLAPIARDVGSTLRSVEVISAEADLTGRDPASRRGEWGAS